MGGKPDWFEVTKLEVLSPGGGSGDPMMDVIEITAAGGDAFDLLVSFEGPTAPWLGLAEAWSDATPAIPAECEFTAESIGPGLETVISGTGGSVDLTAGGDPGGGPAGTSWYQARLQVADASTVFVDAGVLQPGLYRIGCIVSFDTGVAGFYAYAYYQQDLLIRVVER